MEKRLNFKYAMNQFWFSTLTAASLAFASVYLLYKGFDNSTIGFILATCSLLSIGLQTVIANVIDTHKQVKLQDVMSVTILLIIGGSVLLNFVSNPLFVIGLILLIFTLILSNVPLVNSLAFIYEEQGVHIKYGAARGLGSLAYAVTTMILGFIIEQTSPNSVPAFYVLFSLIFLIAVRGYHLPKEQDEKIAKLVTNYEPQFEEPELESNLSMTDFVRKYKRLVLLVLGVVLLLFSQTLIGSFFIQIITPIGGDSAQMGVAVFIAAGIEFPVMMRFDWLSEKRPVEFWLKLSLGFFVAKNIFTYLATSMFMIYFAQFLQFGAYALAYPALVKYVNLIVEPKDLVKGQTLLTIGTTLSSVFANLLGGILIDQIGVNTTLLIGIGTTLIGAVIILKSVVRTTKNVPTIANI